MADYVLLVNWTDQGIKSVKESPKRLDAARKGANKFDCELTDFALTIGPYDMMAKVVAPNDEALAKFVLFLGSGGNVRTTTLKTFSEDQYRNIIGALG